MWDLFEFLLMLFEKFLYDFLFSSFLFLFWILLILLNDTFVIFHSKNHEWASPSCFDWLHWPTWSGWWKMNRTKKFLSIRQIYMRFGIGRILFIQLIAYYFFFYVYKTTLWSFLLVNDHFVLWLSFWFMLKENQRHVLLFNIVQIIKFEILYQFYLFLHFFETELASYFSFIDWIKNTGKYFLNTMISDWYFRFFHCKVFRRLHTRKSFRFDNSALSFVEYKKVWFMFPPFYLRDILLFHSDY